MRRYLYRCTGDWEAANDLLSQTFLQAAEAWHQYRGQGSREAWLFGIARNAVRDTRRRGRLRRTEPLAADIPAPDPKASGKEADERAQIWGAVAELPEQLRQTLSLRIADEMSYVEIAAALEVPVSTVRSRLHEAIRRLRVRLSAPA